MVRLLLQYEANTPSWTRFLAEQFDMRELLSEADSVVVAVAKPEDYLEELRDELTTPLRMEVTKLVLVAMIRSTGLTPQLGIVSKCVLPFCKCMDNYIIGDSLSHVAWQPSIMSSGSDQCVPL